VQQKRGAVLLGTVKGLSHDAMSLGMGCTFEIDMEKGTASFKCFPPIADTRPHGEGTSVLARPPPTRDLRAVGAFGAQAGVNHQNVSPHPSNREQMAVGGRQVSKPSAFMRPSPQPTTPARRAQVNASPNPKGGGSAQTPNHFKAKIKWLKEILPEVPGVTTRNTIKEMLDNYGGDIVAAGESILEILSVSNGGKVSVEECTSAYAQLLQRAAELSPIQE
jgi:hypothetical protein